MKAHIHYTIYNIHYTANCNNYQDGFPGIVHYIRMFTYCYWMSSLVGCAGVQHWLLPTSPSRHPSGGVCSHGLVLVSPEMRSLSI